MALDKQLNISDLEFDKVKDNIKDFLRGQDTFTDFDFEGSGMSVMLDVMAYTTHYMGFHANMAINESFLDTATLRNSVVSNAILHLYLNLSKKKSNSTISCSLIGTYTIHTAYLFSSGTAFTVTDCKSALGSCVFIAFSICASNVILVVDDIGWNNEL